MKKLKIVLKPVFILFSGLQVTLSILAILILSSAYLYLVTKDLAVSIGLGFLSSLFAFYHTVFIPKKLQREQFYLKELQKYATSMTFYLQGGNNVLQALRASKESLDRTIQKEIEITIDKLEKEAKLDTEHFKKYKFPSIDIFHQILRIKYEVGGNAKELFTKVNQSINFEIVKRDELFRKKNYMKLRVIYMMLMVLSIPLILRLFSEQLYDQYLSIGPMAILTNSILFIALLISLFFLQKASADISIQD